MRATSSLSVPQYVGLERGPAALSVGNNLRRRIRSCNVLLMSDHPSAVSILDRAARLTADEIVTLGQLSQRAIGFFR